MQDPAVAETVVDPVEAAPEEEKTVAMNAETAVTSHAIADVEAVAGNFHRPCVLSRNGEVTSRVISRVEHGSPSQRLRAFDRIISPRSSSVLLKRPPVGVELETQAHTHPFDLNQFIQPPARTSCLAASRLHGDPGLMNIQTLCFPVLCYVEVKFLLNFYHF